MQVALFTSAIGSNTAIGVKTSSLVSSIGSSTASASAIASVANTSGRNQERDFRRPSGILAFAAGLTIYAMSVGTWSCEVVEVAAAEI